MFNEESEETDSDGVLARRIRYINAIETNMSGNVFAMFVADGNCNLFSVSRTTTE